MSATKHARSNRPPTGEDRAARLGHSKPRGLPGCGVFFRATPTVRLPLAPRCEAAVGKRLGHVQTRHTAGAVEVGQGARHAHDPVVAARG